MTILISEFSTDWSRHFHNECNRLAEHLAELAVDIHHIGSTAINGIKAKPCIDILIEMRSYQDKDILNSKLTSLGYSTLRRNLLPDVSFFAVADVDALRFHLHCFEQHDPQIERHIRFRDYLNSNKASRDEYENVKVHLSKKYGDNPSLYTKYKTDCISRIDRRAYLHYQSDTASGICPCVNALSSKCDIEIAVKLNLYLFHTHFAQYVDAISLLRGPGMTSVSSETESERFNCIHDIDLAAKLADEILKVQLKNDFNYLFYSDQGHEFNSFRASAMQLRVSNHEVHIYSLLSDRPNMSNCKIVDSEEDFDEFINVVASYSASTAKYLGQWRGVAHNSSYIRFMLFQGEEKIIPVICVFYASIIGVYSVSPLISIDRSILESISGIGKEHGYQYLAIPHALRQEPTLTLQYNRILNAGMCR